MSGRPFLNVVTLAAFASFGPYDFPNDPSMSEIFLVDGRSTSPSLNQCQFRFVDGQVLKPGAKGLVHMTFPQDQTPPGSGPLPIWAGSVVGHVWGLHLVHGAQPDTARCHSSAEHVSAARPPVGLGSAPVNDMCHTPSSWRTEPSRGRGTARGTALWVKHRR